MKVVLFCGGLGMRLRDYSENVPKPLVEIGYQPILMHLMRYYAHFGHKDFILCLGYRADAIKKFFLSYNEAISNDFVLSRGGRDVELLHRDIEDWTITFVDTGLQASIGERLWAVQKHVKGEELFLANYTDSLTDLDLGLFLERFDESGKLAGFLSVPAPQAFHIVHADPGQLVTKIQHVGESHVRINGGFFAFRRKVFDYMRPGEELVAEPFQRLIEARELWAYPYEGFWGTMDTFKDKQTFEDMLARGERPWEVWKRA